MIYHTSSKPLISGQPISSIPPIKSSVLFCAPACKDNTIIHYDMYTYNFWQLKSRFTLINSQQLWAGSKFYGSFLYVCVNIMQLLFSFDTGKGVEKTLMQTLAYQLVFVWPVFKTKLDKNAISFTLYLLCWCNVLRWIRCLWCYSECISPGQAWKNMPGHSGNRTYDINTANIMIIRLHWYWRN